MNEQTPSAAAGEQEAQPTEEEHRKIEPFLRENVELPYISWEALDPESPEYSPQIAAKVDEGTRLLGKAMKGAIPPVETRAITITIPDEVDTQPLTMEQQLQQVKEMAKAFERLANAAMGAAVTALQSQGPAIEQMKRNLAGLQSLAMQNMLQGVSNMAEMLQHVAETAILVSDSDDPAVLDLLDELQPLLPYMPEDLRKSILRTNPEDLLDDDGKPIPELAQAMEEARAAKEKAEKAKAIKDLPLLPELFIARKYVIPRTMLSKDLAGMEGMNPINNGPYNIEFDGKRDKRLAGVSTFVDLTNRQEVSIKSHLSQFQNTVKNAAYSVILQAAEAGETLVTITPEQIIRNLPGKSEPSPQLKGAVVRALDPLRTIDCEIDATNEMRKRGIIPAGDTYYRHSTLLQATFTDHRSKNGKKVQAWRVLLADGLPIELDYAVKTRQISSVPRKFLDLVKVEALEDGTLLNTGKPLQMSDERRAIVLYMILRVEAMKSNDYRADAQQAKYDRKRKKDETLPEKEAERGTRKILFSTIWTAAEIDTNSRQAIAKYREFVLDVLQFWKYSGYIYDFSITKAGKQKIAGIEILLQPAEKGILTPKTVDGYTKNG